MEQSIDRTNSSLVSLSVESKRAIHDFTIQPWDNLPNLPADFLEEILQHFLEDCPFENGATLYETANKGIVAFSFESIPKDEFFETKSGGKFVKIENKIGKFYSAGLPPKDGFEIEIEKFMKLREKIRSFVVAICSKDYDAACEIFSGFSRTPLKMTLRSNPLSNYGTFLEFGKCYVDWNLTKKTGLPHICQVFRLRHNPLEYYSFPFEKRQFVLTMQFSHSGDSIIDVDLGKGDIVPPGQNNQYVIRFAPQRHIHTKSTFLVKKGEEIALYFMKPAELPQVRNVKIKAYLDPGKIPVELERNGIGASGEEMMKTVVHAKERDLTFTVEMEHDYYQRLLDLRRDSDENYKPFPLSDEERDTYLRMDSSKYNWDQLQFQTWLHNNELFIKKDRESEVVFGYRALITIQEHIAYSAKDELRGCGTGGVNQGVVDGETDCGGLALILSAVMRANGIPARLMQGQICDFIPADPALFSHLDIRTTELRLGFHAMAEFYATDVGWVPVEVTDRRLITFGKDSKSHPFISRHFDFIYDLECNYGGKQRTVHPIFMSVIYPYVIQGASKNLVYEYSRQRWSAEEEVVIDLRD